jgi:hypothetical protein
MLPIAMLTVDLPETPQAQPAYRLAADCPHCGAPLVLRQNRQTGALFTGCSAYPGWAFTEPHDFRVQTLSTGLVQAVQTLATQVVQAQAEARRQVAEAQAESQRQRAAERATRWSGPCGSSWPWRIPIAGRTRRWRMSSRWPWWRCARRCTLAPSDCRPLASNPRPDTCATWRACTQPGHGGLPPDGDRLDAVAAQPSRTVVSLLVVGR